MPNIKSQHILPTSANLLGLCLIVVTSLHLSNNRELHLIIQITSFISVMLAGSTLFSYLSIKTDSHKLETRFEKIADWFFLIALLGIVTVIVVMFINFFAEKK